MQVERRWGGGAFFFIKNTIWWPIKFVNGPFTFAINIYIKLLFWYCFSDIMHFQMLRMEYIFSYYLSINVCIY